MEESDKEQNDVKVEEGDIKGVEVEGVVGPSCFMADEQGDGDPPVHEGMIKDKDIGVINVDELTLQGYSYVPGIFKKTLEWGVEEGKETQVSNYPREESLVKVRVRGIYGSEEILEEKEVEYFLGEGYLQGLPIGVDAAICRLTLGEKAVFTFTNREFLRPIFNDLPDNYGEEDGDGRKRKLCMYIVTLLWFQNIPVVPEQLELEERVTLCDKMLGSAKILLKHKKEVKGVIARCLKKYARNIAFLDPQIFTYMSVPDQLQKRMKEILAETFLEAARFVISMEGYETSDDEMMEGTDPLNYFQKKDPLRMILQAASLNPTSEAHDFAGELHLKRHEPLEALKCFEKSQEVEPNHEKFERNKKRCMEARDKLKNKEKQMFAKMLSLKI